MMKVLAPTKRKMKAKKWSDLPRMPTRLDEQGQRPDQLLDLLTVQALLAVVVANE